MTEEEKKWTDDDFDLEEVHKYGEVYVEYAKKVRGVDVTYYGNWQRDFAKLIIELLDFKSAPGKEWNTILDVGCSTALNLRGIDELGIFSRLIGIDYSQYLIDLGQKLYNFEDGIFHATPSWDLAAIKDDDVDALICTHVLEHLPNEERLHETLEEFKRVLHPDGKIIFILPCTKEENEKDDLPLHHIMHTSKWWSKVFASYFKSESYKARQLFRKTKLRPTRSVDATFSEVYETWSVFKFIHKND